MTPLPSVNAGVDFGACAGSSITLSATGASSYTWDNAVINGQSFQAPATTTTYTVTGLLNGCTNTDQVVVTINQLPSFTAGVDQSKCAGQTVTLTSPNTNGVTFSWSDNVVSGQAFTPTITKTYTLTGVDGNSCSNTGFFNFKLIEIK